MQSEVRYLKRIGRKEPWAVVGVAVLLVFALLGLVPQWFTSYPPQTADPNSILLPPSFSHWMGTDINGMDVFTRVVWASRVDLEVAAVSTTVALSVGVVVGSIVGYYFAEKSWRGVGSEVVLRGMDALQAFPVFVLALSLVAVLGRNIGIVMLVIAVLGTPVFIRLTRSAIFATRAETYVEAAKLAGNSQLRLILKHVMPNSLGPAFATASIVAGSAILLTSGLSFIGAGVPAPTPEWGSMVAIGAPSLYTGQWWPALFPGATIGLVVMTFALVGEGIKQYFDPVNR